MNIDTSTLILVNAAIGIISSIMLTINWGMNPKIQGTKEWSLALWCWALSMIALLFRDALTPSILTLISNSFVVVGSFFLLKGLSKYHNKPNIPHWLELVITISMIAVFWYFLRVEKNDANRLLLVVSFSAIIKFIALYFLIPTIKRFHAVGTIMALGFLLHGFFFLYYSFLLLTTPEAMKAVLLSQMIEHLLIEVFLFILWFTVSVSMLTNITLQIDLKELAEKDPLTGLLNRRSLFKQCEQALSFGGNDCLSILVLDLDKFKQINDIYGHAVGDDVLIHFTLTVKRQLRAQDIFGRTGGEEFVIGLPDTTEEKSKVVAERICSSVRSAKVNIGSKVLDYTVSIGSATAYSEEPHSLKELIDNADAAMYQAKQKGRNRVEVFIREEANKIKNQIESIT